MNMLFERPISVKFCLVFMLLLLLASNSSKAVSAHGEFSSGLGVKSSSVPGIDLDVTYISRTPRYKWDAKKKWPDPGEAVTFTAHIINKGSNASGPFSFQWRIDGRVVKSGSAGSISPQGKSTQTFVWAWQTGRHTVSFKADSSDQIAETAENNNLITDYTDALSVGFWVEQSVYNDFNSKQNGIGTYSWEDWAQYQIKTYNELLQQSQLPRAPNGVLTRLRLDKIVLVSDGKLFDLNYQHAPIETVTDVQWGFSVEEYLNCPWAGCYDISWNVHHELGHYLFGRVDLYGLDVQGGDVDVRDSNGNLIAGTPSLPYIRWDIVHYNSRTGADLMTTSDYPNPVFLSDHTVYSLNQDWPIGQRTHRGWTYIYDIPEVSKLQILDNDNQPIPGIEVSVYQAVNGDGASGPYSQYFDNTADIIGTTDSNGIMSLGSKPFGEIQDYWGLTAGDILVKLVHPVSEQTRYVWVEVLDFNLAYWAGKTASYIHVIHFPEGQPRLSITKNQLTFSALQGRNPTPQKVDVKINGEGAETYWWVVSKSTVPWLRTIPYSNQSELGFPSGPLSFVVNSADLPPGIYTSTVTITTVPEVTNSPQTISITLNVRETTTSSLKSIAAQDGWIVESSELSNKGGKINSTATTVRVGDDAARKQYRSILSFSTKGLPDNAEITKVTLKLRQQGIAGGGNPINTFQGFMVDIENGFFGSAAGLQVSDFQASADESYGPFKPALVNGWYTINLTPAKAYINKLAANGGMTQMRLHFKLDDNNNTVANYLSLYSGNAPAASRPQLMIEYYVP